MSVDVGRSAVAGAGAHVMTRRSHSVHAPLQVLHFVLLLLLVRMRLLALMLQLLVTRESAVVGHWRAERDALGAGFQRQSAIRRHGCRVIIGRAVGLGRKRCVDQRSLQIRRIVFGEGALPPGNRCDQSGD